MPERPCPGAVGLLIHARGGWFTDNRAPGHALRLGDGHPDDPPMLKRMTNGIQASASLNRRPRGQSAPPHHSHSPTFSLPTIDHTATCIRKSSPTPASPPEVASISGGRGLHSLRDNQGLVQLQYSPVACQGDRKCRNAIERQVLKPAGHACHPVKSRSEMIGAIRVDEMAPGAWT